VTPQPGKWNNPAANWAVQPVPQHMHVIGSGYNQKVVWDPGWQPGGINRKRAGAGGTGGTGSTHTQSKTLADGTVVDYNPTAPSGKRYTDPATGKVVNPNDHMKSTTLSPDVIIQKRAAAQKGMAGDLAKDPKIKPIDIYHNMLAGGIPRSIAVQVVRGEARNHPDDPAWQSVLRPGWFTPAPKKRGR